MLLRDASNGNGTDGIFKKRIKDILRRLSSSFIIKLVVVTLSLILVLSVLVLYFETSHSAAVAGHDVQAAANITNIEDAIWWAFVTSTSVGYGDYYPKSSAGRMFGIILMFLGISLIGVITGHIASKLVERQIKEGKGLKDLNLSGHFIICGWKRDMAEVLSNILEKNKSYLASEIVLVNQAQSNEIDNLRSDSRFTTINYIHGDYIDERVLNRANLKKASKVLILADRLVTGSVQEIDSRTVMSVITIKALSKSVYVCAELLDSKFERYLRLADCDELILSTEYNRSLLANASTGSGISHVVKALLDVRSGVSIFTPDIPDNFIGKTYGSLFDHYLKRNRTILIGILENTGNFFSRKTEAIREAQKTPDISTLVDNLRTVKTLSANEPVLNPATDYIIKKYTKAIVIEGKSN